MRRPLRGAALRCQAAAPPCMPGRSGLTCVRAGWRSHSWSPSSQGGASRRNLRTARPPRLRGRTGRRAGRTVVPELSKSLPNAMPSIKRPLAIINTGRARRLKALYLSRRTFRERAFQAPANDLADLLPRWRRSRPTSASDAYRPCCVAGRCLEGGRSPCEWRFTAADVRGLAYGMLPGSSDDKWVATFPRRLPAFHRNWTGFHVYRLPSVVRAAASTRRAELLHIRSLGPHASRDLRPIGVMDMAYSIVDRLSIMCYE